MGFNFPNPPDHMVYPQTAQTVAEIVGAAVVLGFIVYAVLEWRRLRTPLPFLLLIGGAIAYFNEPFDDVLGLVWFPRPNMHQAVETLGPIPLWGLFAYIVFFGGATYLFLKLLQRGDFTLKRFWIGVVAYFVLDTVIEIPVIQLDFYRYYSYGGDPPMNVAGFPLYWTLNAVGPILCAAILFCAPDYFRGWRMPAIVLLPLVTYAGTAVAIYLPVYSAIHSPDATEAVRWGAAFLTVAIGLFMLDGLSRLILARTRALQEVALPTGLQPVAADTLNGSVRAGANAIRR
jgi:hypothetical protein